MPPVVIVRSAATIGPLVTIVCKGAGGSGGSVSAGGGLDKAGGDGGLVVATFRKADLPATLIVQVGGGGQAADYASGAGAGGWPAGGQGAADWVNHAGGSGGGR